MAHMGGETAQDAVHLQAAAPAAGAARLAGVESMHHLGLPAAVARAEFADVRFVCVGGTDERARGIAEAISAKSGLPVRELSRGRFVVFKVGHTITASHGMGGPSISIALNELIQALIIAENCRDVTFFRVGTTGGIGIKPGTAVLTTEALNEMLEPFYEIVYMGKRVQYPTKIATEVVQELLQYPNVATGKTMTANCFYENQGRVDGAFCDHTEADKQAFLQRLSEAGVRNIEMEVVPFSAIVSRAGLRAVACCTVLVNRLEGEHVENLPNGNYALEVVADYIANKEQAWKAPPQST